MGRLLRRLDRRVAEGHYDSRIIGDQRLREFREPFDLALGEPVLEANVATIDLPECRQRASKLCRHRLDRVRRVDAQDPDEREICGILRNCRSTTAEREDKESPNVPHSITSSAWARIRGGIVSPTASAGLS